MVKNQHKYSKEPTFKQSGLEQPITRFASPLISHQSSNWVVYGTCIIIAPGFAITAKHVVEGLIGNFDKIKMDHRAGEDQEFTCSHNSYVFQIVDGKTGYRWDVRQYFLSTTTDICFLRMNPMFNINKLPGPQKVGVTLYPPDIGERIVGFGYPKSNIIVEGDIIKTEVKPMTTVGEVIEIRNLGRDQRLPFPVFRTNAGFDAGMSGGPVFNESGKLCGIICSNMAPLEPDKDHISYVSLIWPSMDTKVWMKLAHHDRQDQFPVLFLAKHNYIHVDGWDRVDVSIPGKIGWRRE